MPALSTLRMLASHCIAVQTAGIRLAALACSARSLQASEDLALDIMATAMSSALAISSCVFELPCVPDQLDTAKLKSYSVALATSNPEQRTSKPGQLGTLPAQAARCAAAKPETATCTCQG